MSSILGISGVSDATALSRENEPVAGSSEMNRDTFLMLLTTQLQNQDPTAPMDNQEFVAQLAQFTTLEQQVTMNSTMESVYMGIASMNNATMAALVGTDVVAVGNGFEYDGEAESVELHYKADDDVSSGTLTIYDEEGRVVYSREISGLDEGEGSLTWDGTDSSGERAEAGNYTFEITGTDSQEKNVAVHELVVGTITEMDYSSGGPRPTVEGYPMDIGDILRLTHPSNSEDGQSG